MFDPYADTSCLPFRISDDIAAVVADLIHGLRHYQACRSLEALWWWQYSYFNHWGTHGGAALRALHAVVAHASLDVAEETHEHVTVWGPNLVRENSSSFAINSSVHPRPGEVRRGRGARGAKIRWLVGR